MGNNLVRKLTLGLLLIVFVVPILTAPLTALAIDPPPAGGAPASSGRNTTNYSFQSDHIQINYGTCDWDDFGCHLAKVFKIIVIGILSGLGGFFAGMFELFTQATLVMIRFGTIVMQLGVVREGARATMSVANLLFVLALIVIAFATIFQASAYSAKALLKKLIIAAILVNFSFLIAGLLLDVANVFTNSFASKFNAATIASSIQPQRIAASLILVDKDINFRPPGSPATGINYGDKSYIRNEGDAHGTLVVNINNNATSDDGWKLFLKITAALLFSVLMTFLLMCVMISLALMTLARNIWVAILLILMPIVWALQFLPELSEKWKAWWSKFLKWTIYLPVITFFIYVSTFAATGLDTKVAGIVENAIGSSAAGYAALLTVTVQVLIVCGLLIGGLLAAKASGGFGAAAGLGLAAWASGKIKGTAMGGVKLAQRGATSVAKLPLKAAGAGGKFVGRQTGYAASRFFGNLGGSLATSKFARALGLGGVANRLAGLGSTASTKAVEDYQKKNYSNLSNDQFERVAASSLPITAEGRAALLAEAVKRKKLDSISKLERNPAESDADFALRKKAYQQKRLGELSASAQTLNTGTKAKDIPAIKDVLSFDPTLLSTIAPADLSDALKRQVQAGTLTEQQAQRQANDEAIAAQISKMSSGDVAKISSSALKDQRVVGALGKSQALSVMNNGSDEQEKALRSTLENILGNGNAAVVTNLKGIETRLSRIDKDIKDAQARGDTVEVQRLQQGRTADEQAREAVFRGMADPAAAKKAHQMLAYLDQTPGKTTP